MDDSERRIDKRTPCSMVVRVYRTDGSNRVHDAVCTDVSHGGVGLDMQAVLAVGQVVEIEFAGPTDSERMRHRARVMYRSRDHYGLAYCGPKT